MKLALLILLLSLSGFARAADLWIGPSATGNGSGTSSGNLESYGDWNTGTGQLDNVTMHIVGVIGSINVQANNETILIPGGSGISSQAGNGIYVNANLNALTVDGTGGGFIANTANGSALAYQAGTWGIVCGGNMCCMVVKNIAITNTYVHSSLTDGAPGSDQQGGIWANQLGGSNFFGNVYVSNAATCFLINGGGTTVYSNCTMAACNHGVFPDGSAGASSWIENCHFTGCWSNWETTANTFHNDGILYGGSGNVNNMIVRWNTFDAQFGNETTCVFFNDRQTGTTTNYIQYGNLVIASPADYYANGAWSGGGEFYGNTMIGNNAANNVCLAVGPGTVCSNNAFVSWPTFVYMAGMSPTGSAFGYNYYINWQSGSSDPWNICGTSYTTSQFSSYLAALGEGNSEMSTTLPGFITSLGYLISGSPLVNAGSDIRGRIPPFDHDGRYIWPPGSVSSSLWPIGAQANPTAATPAIP
jgi:hypothetical protein